MSRGQKKFLIIFIPIVITVNAREHTISVFDAAPGHFKFSGVLIDFQKEMTPSRQQYFFFNLSSYFCAPTRIERKRALLKYSFLREAPNNNALVKGLTTGRINMPISSYVHPFSKKFQVFFSCLSIATAKVQKPQEHGESSQ